MEQRKNLRFPVKFRSSFSSIGLVGGEGNIVDLSIRGCRIESSIDVQPGASLDVRITVVENDPPQFRFRQRLSGGAESGNSALSLR